jgi:hypothetical protein
VTLLVFPLYVESTATEVALTSLGKTSEMMISTFEANEFDPILVAVKLHTMVVVPERLEEELKLLARFRMVLAALIVVVTLAHVFVLVQLTPGVDGLLPPDESTAA